MMQRLIHLILLCLLYPFASLVHANTDAVTMNAGFMHLTTSGEYEVPVAVWYPTKATQVTWNAGPYVIDATPDAPLAEGKHPLIILSHGSGGSEFGHADLAQALARHGYIVVAPRHLGDSYDAADGRGTKIQTYGRPWQIEATLATVLSDKRLAPAIDNARIGMTGFSAGGYTTMIMAGAKPNFALHGAYCAAHADDNRLCDQSKKAESTYTMPGWQLPVETRIRAALVMAPLSVMFDEKSVADIKIPLKVYKASDDQELRNPWNTDHLLSVLPANVERGEVQGGHFVFLAPCSAALTAAVPDVCVDARGVDRAAIHAKLNGEIVDFFNRTL
jgi:predicted dienelactone hydrolase